MQGIGWLILFIADLIFDLVSIYFRWNDLRYITKPLLTILLGVYSFQLLRSAPFLLLFILTALGLSGAGDGRSGRLVPGLAPCAAAGARKGRCCGGARRQGLSDR